MLAAMDGQQELMHYVSKFEAFRSSDEEREHMVASLLRRYQTLCAEYQKKCSDFESEVNSRRQYQEEVKRARAEVADARRSKVRQTFSPRYPYSIRLCFSTVWSTFKKCH